MKLGLPVIGQTRKPTLDVGILGGKSFFCTLFFGVSFFCTLFKSCFGDFRFSAPLKVWGSKNCLVSGRPSFFKSVSTFRMLLSGAFLRSYGCFFFSVDTSNHFVNPVIASSADMRLLRYLTP